MYEYIKVILVAIPAQLVMTKVLASLLNCTIRVRYRSIDMPKIFVVKFHAFDHFQKK